MKTKNISLLFTLLLLMSACYEDKGNYDYQPGEKITVTGIDTSYSKKLFEENLVITPVVTSTDKQGEMECSWSWYDTEILPLKENKICDTQELDLKVPGKISRYKLIFRATNKRSGYTQAITSNLNVESYYQQGWYVVKTDDNKTDIDLFKSPEDYAYNTLQNSNSKQPEGRIRKTSIGFRQLAWDPADGELKTFPHLLFLLTEKDAWVIDPTNMNKLRGMENLFREEPAKKDFGTILDNGNSLLIINDGKIYPSLYMGPNDGSFSLPKWRDDKNSDYRLSKYSLSRGGLMKVLLWDELSGSFLSVDYSNILTPLTKTKESDLLVSNLNMDLVYMGVYNRGIQYGILQDKTTGERVAVELKTVGSWSNDLTIKIKQPLKKNDRANQASLFTLNQDEPIFYFVDGDGALWSYDIMTGVEKRQFTPEAGERITYVRHRKYVTNYIVIATAIGGKYKVRMFEKNAGNLNDKPSLVLDGEGEVGDVLYFNPEVNAYNYYPSSY